MSAPPTEQGILSLADQIEHAHEGISDIKLKVTGALEKLYNIRKRTEGDGKGEERVLKTSQIRQDVLTIKSNVEKIRVLISDKEKKERLLRTETPGGDRRNSESFSTKSKVSKEEAASSSYIPRTLGLESVKTVPKKDPSSHKQRFPDGSAVSPPRTASRINANTLNAGQEPEEEGDGTKSWPKNRIDSQYSSMNREKSIYERLGGDTVLQNAVEHAYDLALDDSRLRAYFEKNSRKMRSIRGKMQAFLSGFLGGPELYDPLNLKPAHYHLNITDFHVDAILELFQSSFLQLCPNPETVADTIAALGAVRKELTTGCTVRMELARKNTERGKGLLFEKLGGEAGIANIMDRLYDVIRMDFRLRKFFQGKNIALIKEGQRVYITEVFGGPKSYKGSELSQVHRGLEIDDYFFDCFIMDFEKAMVGLGVDDESIDEALVTLEPIRALVLGRSRGLASNHKLVNGQSVLQRLGGDQQLEAIVEIMYHRCQEDPRVKYFFMRAPERIKYMKRQMTAVLTKLSGGVSSYEFESVRPAHYDMNITDYHFDAVLENLVHACGVLEVSPSVSADLFAVASKVRSDVTAGCTVRLEVARKKTEIDGTRKLFRQLGEDKGLAVFINTLYEVIQDDPRVALFFSGSKLESLKKSQGVYLAQLFGSSEPYQGRPLPRVHQTIKITDYHFDCFLEDCTKALRSVTTDGYTVDECIVLMETAREDVVHPNQRKHSAKRLGGGTKTVYERFGGEQNIKILIDYMYDRALADDRLKSFFELSKFKVQSIRRRMTSFLCGLSGGGSRYSQEDLRPTHACMNITDYHFDSIMELIEDVMNTQMLLEKDVIRDMVRLLQPLRAEIIGGCTVRMEVARMNMKSGRDRLFIKLGREAGIQTLIDDLYDILMKDYRIKHILQGKVESIKAGQLGYITEMLGGPKLYKGRDLSQIHENLGLSDYHFDAFLMDFDRVLKGRGYDESIIDEVLITLESIRSEVLNRSRGAKAAALFPSGQPLLERLGGEMNLESIVEYMYDLFLEDSRLKFHFGKGKAKQRQIRMRMSQYLASAFGGKLGGPASLSGGITYDAFDLRVAHYNMNITDFHFDAVCEAFRKACAEFDCDAQSIEDAIQVVNRIRPDITTGCTVRMELACRKNESGGRGQLFSRLGGMEGMRRVVSRLYDCVERDRRINIFFEGTKLATLKESQTNYLVMALGGPVRYEGRTLEDIHVTRALNDFHFDCFLQNFQRAVVDEGGSSELIDEVTVVLEGLRKRVLDSHYKEQGYVVR